MFALLLAIPPSIACAQDAVVNGAVLKYAGEPIRVPFACSEDQIQAAGLLCTEAEPCPIYLELSAVASAGKKLFVAGNLHAQSGTLESILLASDDAGATWKEPAARTSASALDLLQFHDLEHGWAAGEVQYPLPGDPFVMLTSDGGQTWRRSAVSEDGVPGSVQRFWFDSAKHGLLIVDAGKPSGGARYVLWETENGGDSWTLKSAGGAAPALKQAGGEPVFRLRAVGEKSYAVEKRTGDAKWETVSAFLIDVASCPLPKPDAPPSESKGPPPQ
jgi:photosystem II stability/assembly factor-like uncharacterized protein